MRISWRTFQGNDGRKVEAQVFAPNSDVTPTDCILFCPGFPGAGATLFEQRHAATIVHEGYTLVVLRHAGTKLDGPAAPSMINNAHRLMMARRNGEKIIGGVPATMDTWLMEPYVALHSLAEEYGHIHVIGNSFGAVAALWSLTEDKVPSAQVRSLLLMAGAQGVADMTPQTIMRIWLPQYIEMARVTDKVVLEPSIQVAATLKYAYEQLPARVKAKLFEDIYLSYLVVKNDEILSGFDTDRFKEAIGGRGDVFLDTIDHAHPAHGFMAHDMPDYPTEYILDILQGRAIQDGLEPVSPSKS
ncbi:MAG: hypothetical protein KGQ41_07445 [Alphaproteobacteria bacterium]|nr:hypothetical protein [Alphaproteobacteria bacterium]